MESQFKQMGLDDIETSTWLRYHYTTKFPYNALIAEAFNKSQMGRFTKANEYDCARSHYSMVKECYDRGFKHILIMEDDIKFLKDNQTFCNYLNNIPNDYDLLQFGGFTADPNAKSILQKSNKSGCAGVKWHKATGKWSADITYHKERIYLGLFNSKEEAIMARLAKEAELCDNLLYRTNTPLLIKYGFI